MARRRVSKAAEKQPDLHTSSLNTQTISLITPILSYYMLKQLWLHLVAPVGANYTFTILLSTWSVNGGLIRVRPHFLPHLCATVVAHMRCVSEAQLAATAYHWQFQHGVASQQKSSEERSVHNHIDNVPATRRTETELYW